MTTLLAIAATLFVVFLLLGLTIFVIEWVYNSITGKELFKIEKETKEDCNLTINIELTPDEAENPQKMQS